MIIATSNINPAVRSPQNNKVNVKFNGEPKTVKDNDSNEYVKVPKSEYNFDKWSWRILIGLTILEIAYLLLKPRKTELWEGFYKELKKK